MAIVTKEKATLSTQQLACLRKLIAKSQKTIAKVHEVDLTKLGYIRKEKEYFVITDAGKNAIAEIDRKKQTEKNSSETKELVFKQIPHKDILPDKGQTRKFYDPFKLEQLIGLILTHGFRQIEALVVYEPIDGKYLINSGHRRWFSYAWAEQLRQQGKNLNDIETITQNNVAYFLDFEDPDFPLHDSTLPCFVIKGSPEDYENHRLALLTNMGFEDLSELDRAIAYYQDYSKKFLPQAEKLVEIKGWKYSTELEKLGVNPKNNNRRETIFKQRDTETLARELQKISLGMTRVDQLNRKLAIALIPEKYYGDIRSGFYNMFIVEAIAEILDNEVDLPASIREKFITEGMKYGTDFTGTGVAKKKVSVQITQVAAKAKITSLFNDLTNYKIPIKAEVLQVFDDEQKKVIDSANHHMVNQIARIVLDNQEIDDNVLKHFVEKALKETRSDEQSEVEHTIATKKDALDRVNTLFAQTLNQHQVKTSANSLESLTNESDHKDKAKHAEILSDISDLALQMSSIQRRIATHCQNFDEQTALKIHDKLKSIYKSYVNAKSQIEKASYDVDFS